jgi:hypothetical protein
LNKLLRAGLQCQGQATKPRPYRTPTRKLGLRAGLDATKLNQLVDEIGADELTATGGL